MKELTHCLKMFIWITFLTGIVYPLLVTAIAISTMNFQAKGSLVFSEGKPIGSHLIAQKFQSDSYFWSRPSAVDYQGSISGGSNQGPISKKLLKQIEERKEKLAISHHETDLFKIPPELIYASASGLDPHISPSAAYFQVDRIVKARNLDPLSGRKKIVELIDQLIKRPLFCDCLEQACVNVFELNTALDINSEISGKK